MLVLRCPGNECEEYNSHPMLLNARGSTIQSIGGEAGVCSGKMMQPGGAMYTGALLGAEKHGEGALTTPDGSSYEGQFQYNRKSGSGTYKYPCGSTYVGQWLDDKQHGFGAESWANGAKYEGEFDNGQKAGQGHFAWSNGSTYKGDFTMDTMHGGGSFIWPDGRSYHGQWESNRMGPVGTMTWPDGRVYRGSLRDGVSHGHGALQWPDGRAYNGQWSEGRQHGEGIARTAKGMEALSRWNHSNFVTWLDMGVLDPVQLRRPSVAAGVHCRRTVPRVVEALAGDASSSIGSRSPVSWTMVGNPTEGAVSSHADAEQGDIESESIGRTPTTPGTPVAESIQVGAAETAFLADSIAGLRMANAPRDIRNDAASSEATPVSTTVAETTDEVTRWIPCPRANKAPLLMPTKVPSSRRQYIEGGCDDTDPEVVVNDSISVVNKGDSGGRPRVAQQPDAAVDMRCMLASSVYASVMQDEVVLASEEWTPLVGRGDINGLRGVALPASDVGAPLAALHAHQEKIEDQVAHARAEPLPKQVTSTSVALPLPLVEGMLALPPFKQEAAGECRLATQPQSGRSAVVCSGAATQRQSTCCCLAPIYLALNVQRAPPFKTPSS